MTTATQTTSHPATMTIKAWTEIPAVDRPVVFLSTAWGPKQVSYVRSDWWVVTGTGWAQQSFAVHAGVLVHLDPADAQAEHDNHQRHISELCERLGCK